MGSSTKQKDTAQQDEQEQEQDTQEQEYPQAAKGGWYVLSDGEKVQGKAKAQEAQAKLDAASKRSRATHRLHDLAKADNTPWSMDMETAKKEAAKVFETEPANLTGSVWYATVVEPSGAEATLVAAKHSGRWHLRVELADLDAVVLRRADRFAGIVSAMRDVCRDQTAGKVQGQMKKVYDNKTSGATHQLPPSVQKARKARAAKKKKAAKAS